MPSRFVEGLSMMFAHPQNRLTTHFPERIFQRWAAHDGSSEGTTNHTTLSTAVVMCGLGHVTQACAVITQYTKTGPERLVIGLVVDM